MNTFSKQSTARNAQINEFAANAKKICRQRPLVSAILGMLLVSPTAVFAASVTNNAALADNDSRQSPFALTENSNQFDSLDDRKKGIWIDPATGDIAAFSTEANPDIETIEGLERTFSLTAPLKSFLPKAPFSDTPKNQLPGLFGQKSLGGAVAATLGCVGGAVGYPLACGASISAAYASAGATIVAVPEVCVNLGLAWAGTCGLMIEQWIDYGVPTPETATRHRNLETDLGGTRQYHVSTASVTCPDNLHLADTINWKVVSGRVGHIKIGCTNSSGYHGSAIGAVESGGTTYNRTCSAGRTLSRIDVKHSGGFVTAINPHCGNATGSQEWTGHPTVPYSSATGTSVSMKCAEGHNAGKLTASVYANVSQNAAEKIGKIANLKLTCH